MVLKTIVGVETLEISQWLSTPDFVRVVRTLLTCSKISSFGLFSAFPLATLSSHVPRGSATDSPDNFQLTEAKKEYNPRMFFIEFPLGIHTRSE